LVWGYGFDITYGASTGPGANVTSSAGFTSLHIVETLQDTSDGERQGLAVRTMARHLTPQLLESPIPYMIQDISTTATFRLAIDQAASTGHELVIVGFGAAGWCGMCFAQLNNATFRSWFKEQVQYANAKGIEVSAYTLMQHNGWGEVTPKCEQTLAMDGVTRGPTACFATEWHRQYREGIIEFIKVTGMGGIETDGQYESIPCTDKSHNHNGIHGGYHYGIRATLDFNMAIKALRVYQTGADGYSFSGANKWNHADTDEFSHLPLWEQQTVGRMYIYDSTTTRLPTSGQIGVNDLATSTAAGCNGRPRVACMDFILGAQYAMGSIPSFRSNKLWDPQDKEAAQIEATITKWTTFYRQWRKPRPSGASGLLVANLVHLLRPDSRHIEAVVHLSADDSAPERALASFVNPTNGTLTANITIPLYYTGLKPGTTVTTTRSITTGSSVDFNGAVSEHVIGADGAGFTDIVVPVQLPASSQAMLLVSIPKPHR